MITLDITKEQGERLASLLSVLCGVAQYKAIKDPTLDHVWHKWHPISKAVAEAMGYQAYLNPNDVNHISIDVK